MKYLHISHDDMLNGPGLRIVLWLSGCNHHCKNCHNPETWDLNTGELFSKNELDYIYSELEKDYISGITLSGGDPFHPNNRLEVIKLTSEIKKKFINKNIWVYTGYVFEDILKWNLDISNIDVIVDGEFIDNLKDNSLHWIGSSNQRIIDINKSLQENKIILFKE